MVVVYQQVSLLIFVSRPTSSRVSSADKVNSTLSFSAGGFSTKSFNGSSNQTVNIPTHTSHLTNNSGFITSSASISGNAGSATKLQTARTINGTSFNGLLTLLRQIGVLLEVFISKMLQLLIPVRQLV